MSGTPTNVGGTLFFMANDGTTGEELWKSDGTATGTRQVMDIVPGPKGSLLGRFTPVGSTLFFVAKTPSSGIELWKSNGTAASTKLVKDIHP